MFRIPALITLCLASLAAVAGGSAEVAGNADFPLEIRPPAGFQEPPAPAEAHPADVLNGLLTQTTSVHARFHQVVRDADGNTVQETDGVLEAARPKRMRWETAEPFAQVMVSDGRRLWLHDVDLEQVTERPLDYRMGNTPAMLLSGDVGVIERSFEVSGGEVEPGRHEFELRPRDRDSPFETLSVVFENAAMTEMRLRDGLGQDTIIRFADIRRNVNIDPKRFSFVPPPGTDVFRQE